MVASTGKILYLAAMFHSMPPGKIDPVLLGSLLAKISPCDPRVQVGPQIGADAAVIEVGNRLLVAASDPITFTADDIGWYAVHVNANDIAVMGATPRWFLATALLPEHKTTPRTIRRLFDNLTAALKPLHISLVGGHTEITPGLDRPILCGTMLGEATRKELITPGQATPGDDILLVGYAAVEGTAIIARTQRRRVARTLGSERTQRAVNFLKNPGISILSAATAIRGITGITGLHDPTEGGIIGGVWEMAESAGAGFLLNADAVPVKTETCDICRLFEINPLQLIASGALLVTCKPRTTNSIIQKLRKQRKRISIIGRITERQEGFSLVHTGRRQPLRPPFPDVIGSVI
jgi:hydrogenase expression/formation protein HypE